MSVRQQLLDVMAEGAAIANNYCILHEQAVARGDAAQIGKMLKRKEEQITNLVALIDCFGARCRDTTTKADWPKLQELMKAADELRPSCGPPTEFSKQITLRAKPLTKTAKEKTTMSTTQEAAFFARVAELKKSHPNAPFLQRAAMAREQFPDVGKGEDCIVTLEVCDPTYTRTEKAASVVAFEKTVSDIRARDEVQPTDAMAKARIEQPTEFASLSGQLETACRGYHFGR